MNSKSWYDKNPGKREEHQKRFFKNHPEWKSLECKRYRKRHPDRNPESCKKYYQNNKERFFAAAARRRALQRKVTVGGLKAIIKIYKRAQWWKQWFDVVVDHIIPLSKGGEHSAKNLQIIYAFENARKGSSLTYKPSAVFL